MQYRHSQEIGKKVSGLNITCLYLDRSNVLWIGCQGDRIKTMKPDTDVLTDFLFFPLDSTDLSNTHVRSFLEDHEGTLWMGSNLGLFAIPQSRDNIVFHDIRDREIPNIAENGITSILEDAGGNLWLDTSGGGCVFYDLRESSKKRFLRKPGDPGSISGNRVRFISRAPGTSITSLTGKSNLPSEELWLGTNNGLSVFDRRTQSFKRHDHDPGNTHTLNENELLSCYTDRSGTFWIGTSGGGVNKQSPMARRFAHFSARPDEPNSLSDNDVWSICEEEESQVLWIGTTSGLCQFDHRSWNTYVHDPNDSRSLSEGAVLAVTEDRSGVIWVGTRGGGLNKLIHRERIRSGGGKVAFERIRLTQRSGEIMAIYEDPDRLLWIGTERGGLVRYDPSTKSVQAYLPEAEDSSTNSDQWVETIREDRNGLLWLGTHGGGVCALDRTTGKFKRYQHDPHDMNSLSNNLVATLCEDRSGNLWIGTADGLNKLDPARRKFTRYFEKDGLPNAHIYGILEDELGHLWISTNNGYPGLTQAEGSSETSARRMVCRARNSMLVPIIKIITERYSLEESVVSIGSYLV